MAASPCRAAAMPRPASAVVTPSIPGWTALETVSNLGLRELACRLNLASRNFDKAAENLGRAAQVHLSGEFLRQVVESEGRAVQAAAQAGKLPLDWSASDCPALDKEGRRRSVRVSTWAATASWFPTSPTPRSGRGASGSRPRADAAAGSDGRCPRPDPGPTGRSRSSRSSRSMTTTGRTAWCRRHAATARQRGGFIRRDAGRIRLDQADDKVGVVDGSDWIKNQIQRQSLPLDDLGLDFYHLSENLHKARSPRLWGRRPQGRAGPGQRLGRPLAAHGQARRDSRRVREQLQEWKGGLRGTSYRQAAEQVLNYVTDRREMIQYPKFLELGRQIGSGPTESMCKATTQRIKGRGMRWDGDNAESIMALEALEQSDAWQDYWEAQLRLPA